MRISEAGGEQAVIDWFKTNCAVGNSHLPVGIGDDCALLPVSGPVLVTTDILIENTHFRTDINHYYDIGWKSVAVNLSDIAAMGGVPTYTFLSIGIPDMDADDAYEMFTGILDCAQKHGSVIAGGDTVFSSSGITISVTQLGNVGQSGCIKRSGARAGDIIFVTGTLGDSIAGLKLLLRDGLYKAESGYPNLVHRHLHPEPRLSASMSISQCGIVSAMMDLSDGLCKDLRRMCEASGVGAVIESAKLPVSDELHKAATNLEATAEGLAAAGGEDYELLFTCPEDSVDDLLDSIVYAGCELTAIGRITDYSDVVLLDKEFKPIAWPDVWEHF